MDFLCDMKFMFEYNNSYIAVCLFRIQPPNLSRRKKLGDEDKKWKSFEKTKNMCLPILF